MQLLSCQRQKFSVMCHLAKETMFINFEFENEKTLGKRKRRARFHNLRISDILKQISLSVFPRTFDASIMCCIFSDIAECTNKDANKEEQK